MKLVIDIPDDRYKTLKSLKKIGMINDDCDTLEGIMLRGVPLDTYSYSEADVHVMKKIGGYIEQHVSSKSNN